MNKIKQLEMELKGLEDQKDLALEMVEAIEIDIESLKNEIDEELCITKKQ